MHKQHGFTLVELVAVMAIWVLLIGMGGLAVVRFTAMARLDLAANRLVDSLTLARSIAIARNQIVEVQMADQAQISTLRLTSAYEFRGCDPDPLESVQKCDTVGVWTPLNVDNRITPSGTVVRFPYNRNEVHIIFDRTGQMRVYNAGATWTLRTRTEPITLEVCTIERAADGSWDCQPGSIKSVRIRSSGMINL